MRVWPESTDHRKADQVAGNSFILGIETAIGGGSLALFQNSSELDSLQSGPGVTRAEDLLPNIAKLLDDCDLSLARLSSIVVSIGPGSFTGIRVGIATVLGLRAASGIRCLGLSVLEAIAFTSASANVIGVVPMGRDLVCLQSFTNLIPDSAPRLVAPDLISSELSRFGDNPVLCHADAYAVVRSSLPRTAQIENIGSNLASLLCLSEGSLFAKECFEPLFIDRRAFTKI